MLKIVIAAATLALVPATSRAQTATSSPPGSTGSPARSATRGPNAGPDPVQQQQVGAPTPLNQQEEHASEKATGSVCKGC